MPASLDRVESYWRTNYVAVLLYGSEKSVRLFAVVKWKNVTASLGWPSNHPAWHKLSVLSKLQRAFNLNTTLKNIPRAQLCWWLAKHQDYRNQLILVKWCVLMWRLLNMLCFISTPSTVKKTTAHFLVRVKVSLLKNVYVITFFEYM